MWKNKITIEHVREAASDVQWVLVIFMAKSLWTHIREGVDTDYPFTLEGIWEYIKYILNIDYLIEPVVIFSTCATFVFIVCVRAWVDHYENKK